jgi:limonene-1,2-epoxide hydrolase
VDTEMKPEDVVLAFYADWDKVGFRKAYENWLHPECVVENPGLGAWHGLDYVLEMFDLYVQAFQRPYCRVDLRNIAVNGNTVLTERTETNENRETGDTFTGDLMSTFVIEDGLIKRWAEYYDPAPYRYGSAVPLGQLKWENPTE